MGERGWSEKVWSEKVWSEKVWSEKVWGEKVWGEMALSGLAFAVVAVSFIDLAAQRARIRQALSEGIERVLAHGRFVLGPEVQALEQALSARSGVAHTIACANGTDALTLALRAEGIGAGDAVFVPAFTFAAPAEAALLSGAVPFFVDIDQDFALDAASLKRAVVEAREQGLRARAVVVVDLYGLPADYESLLAVVREEDLFCVIDAAQSFGACYGGRSTVSLGDVATTSFFPTKPLGCYGDGGAVFAADAERARVVRETANHGQEAGRRYCHRRVGTNSRLDTLQAAVLLAKLAVFDEELSLRQGVAETYERFFRQALQGKDEQTTSSLLRLPRVPEGRSCVWGQYTLRSARRDAICEHCEQAGVATLVHYPLALCEQEAFRRCPVVGGGVPQSEQAAAEVVSLPMHPYLRAEQQEEVVAAVLKAF